MSVHMLYPPLAILNNLFCESTPLTSYLGQLQSQPYKLYYTMHPSGSLGPTRFKNLGLSSRRPRMMPQGYQIVC